MTLRLRPMREKDRIHLDSRSGTVLWVTDFWYGVEWDNTHGPDRYQTLRQPTASQVQLITPEEDLPPCPFCGNNAPTKYSTATTTYTCPCDCFSVTRPSDAQAKARWVEVCKAVEAWRAT